MSALGAQHHVPKTKLEGALYCILSCLRYTQPVSWRFFVHLNRATKTPVGLRESISWNISQGNTASPNRRQHRLPPYATPTQRAAFFFFLPCCGKKIPPGETLNKAWTTDTRAPNMHAYGGDPQGKDANFIGTTWPWRWKIRQRDETVWCMWGRTKLARATNSITPHPS